MEKGSKKRNRIPASCSVCRKRKSKCDRVRPVCGSCKKKSIAHLCYYENEKQGDGGFVDSMGANMPIEMNRTPSVGNIYGPSPGHGHSPNGPENQLSNGMQPRIQVQQPYTHPSPLLAHLPPQHPQHPQHLQHLQHLQPPQPPQQQHPQPLQPGALPPQHSQLAPLGAYPYYQIPQHSTSESESLATTNTSNVPHSYHPITPPQGPPVPNSVPMLHHQHRFPSVNYSMGSGASVSPEDNVSSRSGSIQLPPIKGSETVLISIGPNSILKVKPTDTVDLYMDNASTSLLLEGPYLQNFGFMTYVGLSKNDRFVKFFRKFAVDLVKNGTISEFHQKKKRKKTSNENSPTSKKYKGSSASSPNVQVKSPFGSVKSHDNGSTSNGENEKETANSVKVEKEDKEDEEEEDEEEDDDEYEEKFDDEDDILVVSKVNVGENDSDTKNKDEEESLMSIMPGLKALYSGRNAKKEYYSIVEHAVLKILPSKSNALTLFSRFFKWVHPFVPVVNEDTMVNDMIEVLGKFPEFKNERYTSLNIKKDKHLNIIGMWLVIMRLGYLSLIHNDKADNDYNDHELSIISESRAVPFKLFTDVVNLCITDEHTSPRSSIRMIQLLCLIYFYRQVVPNDCHGLGAADSQILFGTIVSHAISIGLNRDPLKYREHETIKGNKQLISTWRSLWHFIAITDACAAIHRSVPANIVNGNIADVEAPLWKDYESEVKEVYENIREITECYRNLSVLLNDYKNHPKIIEILAITNKLEHIFFHFFGKDFFKDCISKPTKEGVFSVGSEEHVNSYLKVLKFSVFLSLRTNLSSVYYVIAMNYESKYNEDKSIPMSSAVELFKIHLKSVVQLVYIMTFVYENSVELFGKNYDFFITPEIERYMIKTHAFLTSFFIRLIHQKYLLTFKSFDTESMERLKSIDKLFNMILMDAELFVGNFRRLSLRYVNSYKIYVLSYYVLKQCMENAEVFFKYALSDLTMIMDASNLLQYFSLNEIDYLSKMCDEFRLAKDNAERQRQTYNMLHMSPGSANMDNDGKPSTLPPVKPFDADVDPLDNMKDFIDNVFKMNGSPGDTPLADLLDENTRSNDFLKLSEIYDGTNTHLE